VPVIRQTDSYIRWFSKLRDSRARARIDIRIRRVALGNFGDSKAVGSGVSELRIDYGPGYRVYFTFIEKEIVVLLAGGDEAALEDGDSSLIAAALGDIARSKGMASIAEATGLGRESLYKSLSENGNPELATVLKVVDALGLRLTAVPSDSDRAA